MGFGRGKGFTPAPEVKVTIGTSVTKVVQGTTVTKSTATKLTATKTLVVT